MEPTGGEEHPAQINAGVTKAPRGTDRTTPVILGTKVGIPNEKPRKEETGEAPQLQAGLQGVKAQLRVMSAESAYPQTMEPGIAPDTGTPHPSSAIGAIKATTTGMTVVQKWNQNNAKNPWKIRR